jgi:hypothetical protein
LNSNLINNLAARMMQTMLQPNENLNDDRLMFDASNNILLYETFIPLNRLASNIINEPENSEEREDNDL